MKIGPFIKSQFKYVEKLIELRIVRIRKNEAIRLAEENHKATGRRYMVIETGNRFDVINCKTLKAINRRNKKRHKINFIEARENAIYVTK